MLITWNSTGKKDEHGAPSGNTKEASLTPKPSLKIPAMMRRRLTPLGRFVLQTLYEANTHLESQSASTIIPWVTASRHGDADRVGRLLKDITHQEPLSPTDFSQSVNNAIAGAFSIASKNTAMHTSISAGPNSFSMGLLEAYALQKTAGGFVGYAYYDTKMPEQYDDILHGQEDICLVFILGPDDSKNAGAISLRYAPGLSSAQLNSDDLTAALTNFLQGKKKSFSIATAGGEFHLESPVS